MRRATSEGKGCFLWDTELRGFGLLASPTGSVSWLVQKWSGGRDGKAKRISFAKYPPMLPEEARREASVLIGDVHKGVDLVDRKRKARLAKLALIQAPTLADAVELYIARHQKPGSYWPEVRHKFERHVLPILGADITVESITKAEVRALIEAKQDKGHHGAARYLFAVLRPFFRWCLERDLIAKSPLASITPPKPLQARDRVLTDIEIKAFWAATSAPELFNPLHRLLLLTGQRKSEVGGMSWSELDLAKAEWTIPKERTKNSREHLVHLSPQAMTIIQGLTRHAHSDFVFTTTLVRPISGYGLAKRRLDARMQPAKPWRVHDLRRTAASGLAKLGFLPHITERVLNHVSGAQGGLVGVYQRYEYLDDRKRALLAWGNHVEALVTGAEPANNVIPIRA